MKLEIVKILNENFPVLYWQLINRFEAAVWNGTSTDSAVEYQASRPGPAVYGRMSKTSLTAKGIKTDGII